MTRKVVMPKELEEEAEAILTKHGIIYYDASFTKPKPNPKYEWDSQYRFEFFSEPNAINGCCGVIELAHVAYPYNRYFANNLSQEEWSILFNFNVRDILRDRHRRMALITLIGQQRNLVPFVEAAGFEQVSKGYNPGTRHVITVWTLSI
jgi:hypothetical protein